MNNQLTTILMHGLGRNSAIMEPLEKKLTSEQFDVYNLSYPSERYPIHDLSMQIAESLKQRFGKNQFNFVTHSLGSIILRYMVMHEMIETPNRTVMLGPPNHGTSVINLLRRIAWFRKTYGPAALELATDSELWNILPSGVSYPCGIIAGNRSLEPWFSWTVLKGSDDGKVTVKSTKLHGCDHLILPVAHRHLPIHPAVHRQVKYYLLKQQFSADT